MITLLADGDKQPACNNRSAAKQTVRFIDLRRARAHSHTHANTHSRTRQRERIDGHAHSGTLDFVGGDTVVAA